MSALLVKLVYRKKILALLSCALPFLARDAAAADAVADLSARHSQGLTILTWREVDPPIARESVPVLELRELAARPETRRIRYRIYRSSEPLATLEGREPLGEVGQLTAWNLELYGSDPKPGDIAPRYVVEEGKSPLSPGTALFACHPDKAGKAYYAVTVVRDGREGRGDGTSLPVEEMTGPGPFVLQRVERPESFQYIDGPTLHFFVRWEAPPNSSVPGRPFDYLVAIPPKPARPAPVGIHLHCWGGSLLGGYGWWYNAEKGAILIATNQVPYDWWTGYHELLGPGVPGRGVKGRQLRANEPEGWTEGVVRPFTQRRLLSFLSWVAGRWEVDLSRTFAAGSSMGGSGSPMLAIRYPDRIAWAVSWVGIHRPSMSPQFKGSYEQVYGPVDLGVKFEDGTPVWEHYDDVQYLRRHPGRETGFITFSNGKNDGAIGWKQAVDFFRALEETRRPYLFVWGQGGHGERAAMPAGGGERILPIDIRIDQTLPAFTRSSLSDDPGDGDPSDGAPRGQANLHLLWETGDVVDEPGRWALTVGVHERAPKDEGKVDITPRRCQKFRARPGEKFRWTNRSVAAGGIVQSVEAVADAAGLVTLEEVRISKGRNRIEVTALPEGKGAGPPR